MALAAVWVAVVAAATGAAAQSQEASYEELAVRVAILARDHPALVVPAALFLGWLQVGGDLVARNFNVPNEAVGLIQALLLVAVTAAALTRNPRLLQAFGAHPLGAAQ